MIASIWAQDTNGLLGSGSGMLWHVPADFAHFKQATMGSPVIMGRSSWEGLSGPLPGRLNIVLTSSRGYRAEGARVAHSLSRAIGIATDEGEHGGAAIWIAGGASVYAQAMDVVDELVVTDLDLSVPVGPGDPAVYAPAIDPTTWSVDPARSDTGWRERSGDARWRVTTWVRRAARPS